MNVYEIITNSFIADIKAGNNPFWVKPWASIMPRNFVSGKLYRGNNVFWLGMMDRNRAALYATYKQITGIGGSVVKGSKGRQVQFWNIGHKLDGVRLTAKQYSALSASEQKECDRTFSLRYYTVFNINDTEGVDIDKYVAKFKPKQYSGAQAVAACDRYIAATGAKITHGGNAAYYTPARDAITLPDASDFVSTGAYYSTAFHELTHWTGHKTRCDRDLSGYKGGEKYGKEELTAEMGASFLCARFGQNTNNEVAQSTAYLVNWLEAIEGDEKLIVHAGARAQRAVEWLDEAQGFEVEKSAESAA